MTIGVTKILSNATNGQRIFMLQHLSIERTLHSLGLTFVVYCQRAQDPNVLTGAVGAGFGQSVVLLYA